MVEVKFRREEGSPATRSGGGARGAHRGSVFCRNRRRLGGGLLACKALGRRWSSVSVEGGGRGRGLATREHAVGNSFRGLAGVEEVRRWELGGEVGRAGLAAVMVKVRLEGGE
jgi:hypothetical protein